MSLAATESDNFEILRSTDILHGVSDATVKKIAAVARPKTVDEGETVYSVGDPVRSAYVVAAGRLRFVLGGHCRSSRRHSRLGCAAGRSAAAHRHRHRAGRMPAARYRRRDATADSGSGSASRLPGHAASGQDDHAELSRAEHIAQGRDVTELQLPWSYVSS